MSSPQIRNIAIIAHVDHGKTTLVDAMLQQTGTLRANENVPDRVLDSNDLERERGITILAKNASMRWKDYRFNIVDTPGHADFGGEVERTLGMADGAILLVDAAEGPLPQTRFVLDKAIRLGMPIIVAINKIDRKDARPLEVLDEVFGLFCELNASDEQTDFPTLYLVGKEGWASRSLEEKSPDLLPLFETIVERVPPPTGDMDGPLQFLVHNVEHDDYVGRLALGRVRNGSVSEGDMVAVVQEASTIQRRIASVWRYEGMQRVRCERALPGEIIALSGIEEVHIGDTITDARTPTPLPRIQVEDPTLKISFVVNSSPLSGRDGKFVTSRQLRDRLIKEVRRNPALRFEETDQTDSFSVFGRGELMIAVLAETMRREGYEFALAMPEVVVKVIDGQRMEPMEIAVVDLPDEYVGAVTQQLGSRGGQMQKMAPVGAGRTRMEFRIPSRALVGYRSMFLTETRGTGLFNSLLDGWEPWQGKSTRRANGAIVADRSGVTTPYALFNLQPRGVLFVGSGVEVYEGMIVGEHNRANDLDVNAVREKKLTNIRAAGRDENVILSPPRLLTIDTALDFIDNDELVEVTPSAIRLRKRVLEANRRPRRDEG